MFILDLCMRVIKNPKDKAFADFFRKFCATLSLNYCRKHEFGRCSICGNYTWFIYHEVVNPKSEIALSCGWDKYFAQEISLTNSLTCVLCGGSFRARCAAQSLLNYFANKDIRSIAELVKFLRNNKSGYKILETSTSHGIFSYFGNVKNVIKSEYFDDVERGSYKDSVRSEDLRRLTFGDNELDVVIALDVFEHISEPWSAFAEVIRVLKPNGIGVITVPLDSRVKKTKTLAKIENGKIECFGKPAYHSDPLREDVVQVFTEFGMDIQEKLRELGYRVLSDNYITRKTRVKQIVIILKK